MTSKLPPPPTGFKNEITRVKSAVPVPISYPERRFWRFADAPLLSKSFIKVYIGSAIFVLTSYGLGFWAIKRFNLFQAKIFRGNTRLESEVITEFPDLDEALIYKRETFSEKFRKRELERLNRIQKLKADRLASLQQTNQTAKEASTGDLKKADQSIVQKDVQNAQTPSK